MREDKMNERYETREKEEQGQKKYIEMRKHQGT